MSYGTRLHPGSHSLCPPSHLLRPKSETLAVKPLGSLFELLSSTLAGFMSEKGHRGMRVGERRTGW